MTTESLIDLAPRITASLERTLDTFNSVSGKPPLRMRDLFAVGPRRGLRPRAAGSEVRLASDMVVQGNAYQDGTWVGLHNPVDHVGERILLLDTACIRALKWASRSYRMRQVAVEFAAFVDVAHEHGIYWNVAGGGRLELPALVFRHLFFENIGSQAIQIAQRSREIGGSADLSADLVPGGPIVVKDCFAADTGVNYDGNSERASFALSFFGREIMSVPTPERPASTTVETLQCQNDLILRRSVVDISRQTAPIGRFGATCRGTLFVGPRPRALVDGFIGLAGITDRPLARFQGVDDVVIQGSFFHARGGQTWIEFESCGKIRVQGCSGNVQIKIGREIVGSIERGFLRT